MFKIFRTTVFVFCLLSDFFNKIFYRFLDAMEAKSGSDVVMTDDTKASISTATVVTASKATGVPAPSGNSYNTTANTVQQQPQQVATLPQYHIALAPPSNNGGGTAAMGASQLSNTATKYNQLVAMIEELAKDVRPTYNGNRNCAERLKRGLTHARMLSRECVIELERNIRMQQQ